MDTGQALTRFFKRDSTQANNLTLLESQERNFWLWLASWSAWVQSPADLCDCACHAAGDVDCSACVCSEYVLPELEVFEHELAIDHLARTNIERNTEQTYLLADSAVSLQAAAAEKRASIPARVAKLLRILDGYERAGDRSGRRVLPPRRRAARDRRRARQPRDQLLVLDGSMAASEVEHRLAEGRRGGRSCCSVSR